MLCQFLLHCTVTPSYICIHSLSHTVFPPLLLTSALGWCTWVPPMGANFCFCVFSSPSPQGQDDERWLSSNESRRGLILAVLDCVQDGRGQATGRPLACAWGAGESGAGGGRPPSGPQGRWRQLRVDQLAVRLQSVAHPRCWGTSHEDRGLPSLHSIRRLSLSVLTLFLGSHLRAGLLCEPAAPNVPSTACQPGSRPGVSGWLTYVRCLFLP